MAFIDDYRAHVTEREALGVPPLPLSAEQTAAVIEMIKAGEGNTEENLNLLFTRVAPGVDDAAYVKAAFLNDVAQEKISVPSIAPEMAIEVMGLMLGGYNVKPIIDGLESKNAAVIKASVHALKHTLLVYDLFNDVVEMHKKGNTAATEVLTSWAEGEWFTSKPALADKLTVTVFKVPGETNTDDLSPASEAFTRSDIPLHANSMLRSKMGEGCIPAVNALKAKGHNVAYVGDVVGTGSSRKSGINSVQWHMGEDIPGVPNKRTGGVVLGGIIAPIFFATAEDSGALPIELDVNQMDDGDVIDRFSISDQPAVTAEGYRLVWYRSLRKAELDAVARSNRIERALKKLAALRDKLRSPRTRYRQDAKVAEAVAEILQSCEAASWIVTAIQPQTQATFRQNHRGRPGRETQYVKKMATRFDLTYRIDDARVVADATGDGIFPLVTNVVDLSELELLKTYKRQPTIEKRFSQLKTDFEVAPVYLKAVHRIQAFLCMYFFALLVESLLERQLRYAMRRHAIDALPRTAHAWCV